MSYLAFLENLAGLEIEGVETAYSLVDGGPASLDSAQLPAQWVALPVIEGGQVAGQPIGVAAMAKGLWVYRAVLVIAVKAMAQDSYGSGLVEALSMLDRVADGLDAARSVVTGWGTVTAELGVTPELTIGSTRFWAVQAIIEWTV